MDTAIKATILIKGTFSLLNNIFKKFKLNRKRLKEIEIKEITKPDGTYKRTTKKKYK